MRAQRKQNQTNRQTRPDRQTDRQTDKVKLELNRHTLWRVQYTLNQQHSITNTADKDGFEQYNDMAY